LFLLTAILVSHTASTAQDSWPREITATAGKVVIYQPQLESFQGDRVTARAAVSVQKTAMKTPAFGVVWFDSRIATDRDRRTVEFQEIKVTQIKFPNATPAQERKLAAFLDRKIAGWQKRTISLDRLLAVWLRWSKLKPGQITITSHRGFSLARSLRSSYSSTASPSCGMWRDFR
jgi:hypothetical protein